MTVHYIALTYEPKIAAVRQGTVRQTIRRVGKRVYKVGDKLVLHGWAGKPYRSPWNWRTEAFTLKEVFKIYFDCKDVAYKVHPELSVGAMANTRIASLMGCDTLDDLAARDGIVPPSGLQLHKVLYEKNNKNYPLGDFWVLRW